MLEVCLKRCSISCSIHCSIPRSCSIRPAPRGLMAAAACAGAGARCVSGTTSSRLSYNPERVVLPLAAGAATVAAAACARPIHNSISLVP